MSISSGVTTASLAAAVFIPDHASAGRESVVQGIHRGGRELVSQHRKTLTEDWISPAPAGRR